jgi:hypothetical protein
MIEGPNESEGNSIFSGNDPCNGDAFAVARNRSALNLPGVLAAGAFS